MLTERRLFLENKWTGPQLLRRDPMESSEHYSLLHTQMTRSGSEFRQGYIYEATSRLWNSFTKEHEPGNHHMLNSETGRTTDLTP